MDEFAVLQLQLQYFHNKTRMLKELEVINDIRRQIYRNLRVTIPSRNSAQFDCIIE